MAQRPKPPSKSLCLLTSKHLGIFFQCKAGTVLNLSFESLTSREAHHTLRDVQKNDIKDLGAYQDSSIQS